MSLPILVPTTLELGLLGAPVHLRPSRRRLRWRALVASRGTSSPARHQGQQRHHRFAPRCPAQVRAARLAHWRSRGVNLVKSAGPTAAAPIVWRPRTASVYRNLLSDGEKLLHKLLRRRQRRSSASLSALACIARTFDDKTWRVTIEPAQHDTVVFMLISMYWWGCRHPASLCCPRLHPPTALVRWLSRFTVGQQVDHGRQILDMLVAEEARVYLFACRLVEHLMPRAPKFIRAVVLLPEMLRAIELPNHDE
jgi:hypothetical protein